MLSHPIMSKVSFRRNRKQSRDIRATMNIFLLSMSTLFAMTAAEICIRILKNREEVRTIKTIPGHVWRWNPFTQDFQQLEALRFNDSALCSVTMANDLRGKTIVVATDLMNPYILRNANNTAVTGFIGDVWTTLEQFLQFKTIYRRAGPTASQTLMNGHAHALLLASAIYSLTSGYYTYSTPITTTSYALFVQSEGRRISKWWYTGIFSRELWLTAFIFVICITATIMLMYYLKRMVCGNYVECDNELSSASFDLLFVLGGISGQGSQKIPTSWSLRFIILSYLTMGMLLSCGFNSTLTSYLAIRGNTVPISNLQDVLQKRTHSLCVRNDSSAYIHFTVNGSPKAEVIDEWKDLVNKNCPDMRDTSTLSSKLCQPGSVYLEAPDVFLPIYRQVQHTCRIVQMPDAYWRLKIAFLHVRSAQHRHVIDNFLMRLRSAGILKYLEKKWISKEMDNTNHEWNTFQPVEYPHIHLLFLGYILMATVGGLICILENIWYRLRKKLPRDYSNSILIGAPDNSYDLIEVYRRLKLRGKIPRRNRSRSTLNSGRKGKYISYEVNFHFERRVKG